MRKDVVVDCARTAADDGDSEGWCPVASGLWGAFHRLSPPLMMILLHHTIFASVTSIVVSQSPRFKNGRDHCACLAGDWVKCAPRFQTTTGSSSSSSSFNNKGRPEEPKAANDPISPSASIGKQQQQQQKQGLEK